MSASTVAQSSEVAVDYGDSLGAVEVLRAALPACPLRKQIAEECASIAHMLAMKNAAYGNSATDPLRVFSRASAEEALLVRIDDKLSRIARGDAVSEDTVADLIGYLVLYRIAKRGEK